MEQRITNETMAAERILAVLLEGRNMAYDENNIFEGMDAWQWAIDENNDIMEAI